ncbi:MAG: CHAD domain-containing protein [Anaerolineaceae bacterium]|nr:CHAD domain-containing protein [Anaerolineaceae bacterium]MCB9098756.1 CHAD domain-containing protein [Anaerolineales bacterium]
MFDLNPLEKVNLKTIADTATKNVSRRAMIILMTEAGQKPENIAAEVDLTVKVVKRWQREFAKQRMGIFPGYHESQSDTTNDQLTEESQVPELTGQVVEVEVTPVSFKYEGRQKQLIKPAVELQSVGLAEVQVSLEGPIEQKKKKVKNLPKKTKKKKAEKEKTAPPPIQAKMGLEPTDNMAEAGRKVLTFHFDYLLKHETGTRLGEDIEELHDMRVATRRMRAAFQVFGDSYTKKSAKPLLQGLKKTGRALGPVRDLDVFIEKLHHYQETIAESEQAKLQPLFDMLQAQRDKARQAMMDHLDSRDYRRFKKLLGKFVNTAGMGANPVKLGDNPEPDQLRHMGPMLIYDTYAEVRAYETVLDGAPISTLHQLRITCKRLRYTLECLEEVLGPEAGQVISETKIMQDHLGDLHDAEVAAEIIKEFLKNFAAQQEQLPSEAQHSLEQIEAYLAAKQNERHELLVSFSAAWDRFNRREFRKMLAQSVSVL